MGARVLSSFFDKFHLICINNNGVAVLKSIHNNQLIKSDSSSNNIDNNKVDLEFGLLNKFMANELNVNHIDHMHPSPVYNNNNNNNSNNDNNNNNSNNNNDNGNTNSINSKDNNNINNNANNKNISKNNNKPLTTDTPHPNLLPKIGAVVFVNGEADLTVFQSAYHKCMYELADSITVLVDVTDFALLAAQHFNYIKQWYFKEKLSLTLGRCLTQIYDNYENNNHGHLLDIDVINAGFIGGSNVDKNRHCYFHLSRQVIEDIRELIVLRKRAKDRTGRLVKNGGNLYNFLIAPAYVKAG